MNLTEHDIIAGYEAAMTLIDYLDTQLYRIAQAAKWPVEKEDEIRGWMNRVSFYLECEFENGRDSSPAYQCHDFNPVHFLKPLPTQPRR